MCLCACQSWSSIRLYLPKLCTKRIYNNCTYSNEIKIIVCPALFRIIHYQIFNETDNCHGYVRDPTRSGPFTFLMKCMPQNRFFWFGLRENTKSRCPDINNAGITLVKMMLSFNIIGTVNFRPYFTWVRFEVASCSLFLQFKEKEVSGAILASGGHPSTTRCDLQRLASGSAL